MNNSRNILWSLIAVTLIAACSTNSTVTAPIAVPVGAQYSYTIDRRDMTIAGMEALQGALDERLRAADMLATAEAGLPVEIIVERYYMRDSAARVMSGVFAGKDRIVSRVKVTNQNGSNRGEFVVETGNITVFGSEGGLIDRHAEEIVQRLSGR